ncbi:ornithine cyclodeaminase/mu-crystallin [Gemmatirosa kalamazoonensis]|uniref:Ornithine cyclodeaminase/mu-crystallin n=1 Tax=Gemmatirosa kalamazoonensis TaxID=861299 RepID=W0RG22_9BACT|nr:ornithine cyclodeaminase [Gemmatirosa kalamazoonensis]AHG88343.1 ornithine cyclodeaminase/mu-crystallin [Gemmatirosa kalamazoonensis]
MPSIPLLDEDAVRRMLRMDALVPAIRDALAALSAGRVMQPIRTVVPVADHAGFLGSMPAYTGEALGAKLVTFYPQNRGVPTHHAVIVLFHPETGAPAAVLDGRLITEMRTAAASAVATDALARDDARVLGILGAGVQARSHLEALRLVRPLDEVRVWSPHRAAAFADEMGDGVRAVASPEAAVRGADVVLVATTSQVPVLRGAWLAPGTHVNAVGATRPDWRELDDDVVRTARLFVDSRVAATRESGDVIAAGGEPTEIGEVLTGERAGRTGRDEVTLFKSVGVAVEDVVAAALVLAAERRD